MISLDHRVFSIIDNSPAYTIYLPNVIQSLSITLYTLVKMIVLTAQTHIYRVDQSLIIVIQFKQVNGYFFLNTLK